MRSTLQPIGLAAAAESLFTLQRALCTTTDESDTAAQANRLRHTAGLLRHA